MFPKTLTAVLLGAWLGGTLFMWSVATQNFKLVDRLVSAPTADVSERAAALAPGDLRLLMRYQASEVNRLFFERWGWAQLGLGVTLVVLVFVTPADRPLRIAAVTMFLIATALQFGVVPETVRLGRLLDFAPRSPAPPEAASFWRLHHAYTALDTLKLLVGIFAVTRLLRGRILQT